jgi:RNA polymerase sigma-70 factor, ECF subfamily
MTPGFPDSRISDCPYLRALNPKQAPISDAELLRQIAGGDEEALASLYDNYKSILFSLILRILHSQSEAEDILQDVFIQVWQKAANFDEERGRPFTWLVTLARSRAIDRLRQLGSRERTATEASRAAPEEWTDAVEDAIKSEEGAVVRGALAQLPEEQRRALLMAYYEGLTQTEIADKLDTPLGTVKTRMRSGMIKLRELLGDQLKNFF